jgi:hypothetical protein
MNLPRSLRHGPLLSRRDPLPSQRRADDHHGSLARSLLRRPPPKRGCLRRDHPRRDHGLRPAIGAWRDGDHHGPDGRDGRHRRGSVADLHGRADPVRPVPRPLLRSLEAKPPRSKTWPPQAARSESSTAAQQCRSCSRLCLKTQYLASSGSFALWLRPAPSPYVRIWLLRRPCQRPKQLALGPTVAFSDRA